MEQIGSALVFKRPIRWEAAASGYPSSPAGAIVRDAQNVKIEGCTAEPVDSNQPATFTRHAEGLDWWAVRRYDFSPGAGWTSTLLAHGRDD